ncbi:MAG TPA: hypothetical protein VGH36_09940 [Acetobacteraceae bacterium]
MPGTAVVRLNVRVVADFMVGGGSDNGYKAPPQGTNTQGITSKYAPYYFGEYARLYPAFDGVTQNGIKYGASAEIRQNSGGIGINQAFANNNATAGNTLFWRRETMYVGTDKLGTLRFGQTDGVQSLFIVGTFENFDYEGGWDGDLPALFSGGQTSGVGTSLNWNFPDTSAWYGSSKLVYLSPNFGGFDFGFDWEPASNQTSGDGACVGTGTNASPNVPTNTITVGCATVTSLAGPFSLIGSQLATRRNLTTVGARYRGVFGPVGLVAEGAWVHSGHVSDANPFIDPVAFKGLNYFDAGLVGTFGGLAVGGNVVAGEKNATTLLVKGGKHELDFVVGTSYAAGPFIVGASFMNELFQGAWNGNAATNTQNTYGIEHDIGVSVGATFNWAPGASLYVDYLWGQRHQANRDFFAATTGKFNNATRAQGIVIGQAFQW